MTKLHTRMADVGCLVRVSEDTPLAAIRQAIRFAASAEAHLKVVLAVQTFVAPYTPFMTTMAASIAAEVNDKSKAQAESLADTITREAKAAGIAFEIETVAGPFAEVATRAANAARAVDLVVVDQQHGAFDSAAVLLEEALFRSGRPVFVATPQRAPLDEVRHLLVGWDGSAHAVRAVSDALFVFPSVEKVEVLSVSGEKNLSRALPAAEFSRHLARKGVGVTLTDIDRGSQSVAEVLNDYAQSSKADVIVTGAFGHSRLREFLLGGVTVDLTEKSTTSLLMAY